MKPIDRLKTIQCFLLDMDGTFYLDNQLLPGASEFIAHLEKTGIRYLFLTNNSSNSRKRYLDKIHRLGVPVAEDAIFTSGEATALFLKKQNPAPKVYLVGTPALEEEFSAHGIQLTDRDPDFAVLGFDTTLTYGKIWKLCDFVRSGLPYIATHPDINCPTASGYMPDIGSMIEMVASSTGRRPDIIVGKPNPPMVAAIQEKLHIPVDKLAMVGDRLYTDIAMGRSGLMAILTLSGETQVDEIPSSPFQPDLVVANLGELLSLLRS
ncbi:MAG TPA: HAD-IIA family hydrolase [Anaerolineaceae bacterium]